MEPLETTRGGINPSMNQVFASSTVTIAQIAIADDPPRESGSGLASERQVMRRAWRGGWTSNRQFLAVHRRVAAARHHRTGVEVAPSYQFGFRVVADETASDRVGKMSGR